MSRDRPLGLRDDVVVDWFGAHMRPLEGGYSGETFLVGDGDDSVVLRIYRRQPERAVIDASLLRLVRGLVPVPEVLDVRPATASHPALVVTELLPGTPVDKVLRQSADPDIASIGSHLGEVLRVLGSIPFPRFGLFTGADLAVDRSAMPSDLAAWAHGFRRTGRLASWRDQDWRALLRLIDAAEQLVDAYADDVHAQRAVLVHSDFNAKNILVDAGGHVTGVLDWEFAHAGSVLADLGNLTRFERHPELVAAVVSSLADRVQGRFQALLLGRAVDLWALIELAGGGSPNAVRTLARELLLAQARSGDLQAWPWKGTRVDPTDAYVVS